MKMKLTLILLVFLGVGVFARSPTMSSAKAEEIVGELSLRSPRSTSDGSVQVTASGSYGYAMSLLKHVARILGMNRISDLGTMVSKYYSGSLPLSIESLLKTIGISTSLEKLQDTSELYKTMKSIPIVGTIVNFMTSSLSIPINIIALIYSVVTTVIEHMYNSLPSIF